MTPVQFTSFTNNVSIFGGLDTRYRILAWENNEYLIAGSSSKRDLKAMLPEGGWTIKSYDLITMKEKIIAKNATGTFIFDFPDSRAVMFHIKKKQITLKLHNDN